MAHWPTTKQGIRSRIASYRRILRQEFAVQNQSGDGYGKRYWLFHLYFLLREDDEVRAYIDWYVATFPDDIGEVGQFLCWALILRRLGREDEAQYRFVQAIEERLPVVAEIVDDLQAPYGIWDEELWQMYRVDERVIEAMTADEWAWLSSTWRSPAVATMRERYIANRRALVAATTQTVRAALSQGVEDLVGAFRPSEMLPLSSGTSWLTGGRTGRAKRSNGTVIRTTPDVWMRR